MTDRVNPASAIARFSIDLLGNGDQAATADTLVLAAVDVVPGADHASLTVATKGQPRTMAATSELARNCDGLQYRLGEGPCVEALSEQEWYRSGDVGRDSRWPRWGPRAAEEGSRSLVSARLSSANGSIGALNMYSERAGEFGDEDVVDLALLYALHAAIVLGATRELNGLRAAMHHRHTIGIAQGILMQRYDLDQDHAFEVLRRYSSLSNTKLRDIAAKVVEQRDLPPDLDWSTTLADR